MGEGTDWTSEQEVHGYMSLQYPQCDEGIAVMHRANWQSQQGELGRVQTLEENKKKKKTNEGQ